MIDLTLLERQTAEAFASLEDEKWILSGWEEELTAASRSFDLERYHAAQQCLKEQFPRVARATMLFRRAQRELDLAILVSRGEATAQAREALFS